MSFRTCIHVKVNGIQCQSPALRNSLRCYFHHQHRRLKRAAVLSSSLGTSAGRLSALDKVVNATLGNRVDPEVARTLIYGIRQAQLL